MLNNTLFKLKTFIKKFPLLVVLLRKFFKPVRFILNLLFFLLFYSPKKINFIKKILFDSTNDRYLISGDSTGSYFVVSSRDKGVSRAVYANEEAEFNKLIKVLKILKIKKGSYLIDIGANIGTICIPAINKGLFLKSIAFEPDPNTFNLLKTNIHLNGLQENIAAYNFALSDKKSSLKFEISEGNPADNRIRLKSKNLVNLFGEEKRKVITVRSLKLDDIISELIISKKSLIWIDVQGFEGYVLDGAKNILLNENISIVIEFWPYGLKRTQSYVKLKSALLSSGFIEFCILDEGDRRHKLNEANLNRLWAKLGESGKFTDLLILK